jgi:aspartate kinase
VKNTFSDDEGTEIVQRDRFPGRRVTGVTHTGKLVYLQFDLKDSSEDHRRILEAKIFEIMARYGFNLYMMNLSPSGTGFAVPRTQFATLSGILDSLVIPVENQMFLVQIGTNPSKDVENQLRLLNPAGTVKLVQAELTEGCMMVSLVGHEYMQQPGVFYEVLTVLKNAQIPVLQTTDSDFSLSLLIPESETNRAVRILHEQFRLAEII